MTDAWKPSKRPLFAYRMAVRNFIFYCMPQRMEKAMEEVQRMEVFDYVFSPVAKAKVRSGPSRRKMEKEVLLMPGYFFGKTIYPMPECRPTKSFKLLTTSGWGWVSDEDIERVTGLVTGAVIDDNKRIEVEVSVGKEFALNPWYFKKHMIQKVIRVVDTTGEIVMTSPLFGGVPIKIAKGGLAKP